jgi:hypothetical protein
MARFLTDLLNLIYWTTSVTVVEAVTGFAPPVEAVTLTEYEPAGVPGLWVELLLLLQELSHSVEKPSATIRLRKRRPRAVRLREPAVKTIPKRPGSRAAKNIPRLLPRGRRSCAVGAKVGIWRLTEPALVGVAGETVHTEPDDAKAGADASLQVNVRAGGVPLVTVTVMVAVPVCPGVT